VADSVFVSLARPPSPAEEPGECHQHLQPGRGHWSVPGSSLCGLQGMPALSLPFLPDLALGVGGFSLEPRFFRSMAPDSAPRHNYL
jgi:hypothetical protein